MQQVIYTSNTADEQFSTELRVSAGGGGTLSVGSNRDDPTAPVGLFEGRVAPELIRPLFALLAGDAFGGAAHQDVLIPDETFRAISVDDAAGASTVKRVGEQIAASPGFTDVEALLLKIKAALREQPASAVAMRFNAFPTGPDGPPAQLMITNLSRHPVRFDVPMRWGKGAETGGEWVALRSDIDAAQLGSQHQVFTALGDVDVQQFSPSSGGAYVDVAPGAALTVTLPLPVQGWPPGRYDVRLDLTLLLYSADGGSLLQLNLVSAAQPISV